MAYKIIEDACVKLCESPDYNYAFDKRTGFFARWGKTKEDDPERAPGPELLDIEIDTACDGVPGPGGKAAPCRFCYKANRRDGQRMSLDTFKRLFAKFPKTVTQIAFGLTNVYGNDEMWRIFQHTRDNGVIPNVTINGHGLTDELADRLVNVMGAVSVSRYEPKGTCYDAVKMLTDRGMSQCNIHQLVSEETYTACLQVLQDMKSDPRLAKLNAVVFLMLKPKGRGESMTPLRDKAKYRALVDYALKRGLNIGFDSCSIPSFLSVTEGHPLHEQFVRDTDRCESGLFSLYIDVEGKAWPCSFSQDGHRVEPVDVLAVEDFNRDVWEGPELALWRARLCANCRSCPLYDIDVR